MEGFSDLLNVHLVCVVIGDINDSGTKGELGSKLRKIVERQDVDAFNKEVSKLKASSDMPFGVCKLRDLSLYLDSVNSDFHYDLVIRDEALW